MIDTDKYEGHTPAPWDGILSGYFTIEELKEIDKTLMQDAPLLLEEVKRLRDALRIARDSLVWSDEDFIVDEAFAEQIESVRDNIAQVLED
tara:strand:+ start:203 stop:475 length:273 start_codon:yes stop_codon:yes gene_type:complete